MTRAPFSTALDRRVLVCDGAMGTMLYAQGHLPQPLLRRAEPDAARPGRRRPPRVPARRRRRDRDQHVRRQPLQARAASASADQVRAINVAGRAHRAARGARRRRWVAGAIGPLGVRIEPWGKTGVDEARGRVSRAGARRSSRAASICSCSRRSATSNEIGAAIRAVRSVCDAADRRADDDRGGRQHASTARRPKRSRPSSSSAGADVVGVNCSVGPAAMLETIERMARVATRGSSAQPNAGKPRDVEGRNLYLCSPEYMASYARRFIAAACGWSAAAAARRRSTSGRSHGRAKPLAPAVARRPSAGRAAAEGAPTPRPRGAGDRRALGKVAHGQRARARHFVVSVELAPPRGFARRSARRAGAPATHPRRRSGEHSRRPAGDRPDERAGGGGHGPAAGRSGNDPPLFLSRSEPARHAVGPARGARDGRAQPARHHGRSAASRGLSRMRRRCSTSTPSA